MSNPKHIYKYQIPVGRPFRVPAQIDKVLHVAEQNGFATFWATVYPGPGGETEFYLAVTGEFIDTSLWEHGGTFMEGSGRFVGHLFMRRGIRGTPAAVTAGAVRRAGP